MTDTLTPPLQTPPDTHASGWVLLRILGEQLEDAMKSRIACSNRMGAGGLDAAAYGPQLKAMETAEDAWAKALRQTYRTSVPEPIRKWQQETPGIGEHLLARLLGVIGDPTVAIPHRWEGEGEERVLLVGEPRPRRVSDLWAYAGHGDPTRRRRRGQSPQEAAAAGNPRAKVLTHLLAESCMKMTGNGVRRRSPYRDVYDARRALTTEHRLEWTDAHRHADALRIVGKRILLDLWLAAHDGNAPPPRR